MEVARTQATCAFTDLARDILLGSARREIAIETAIRPIASLRGFDVIFDGIGEDGYRRSFTALKRRGLLCAYGYTAGVQAQRRMFTILLWLARLYLSRWLPGAKRACLYSINLMRKRHPKWFREDLEHLFGLLATHAIRPRVAERISFEEVVEAHRRLEAGGVDGKLVLCPPLSLRDVRDKSLALNDRRRRREKGDPHDLIVFDEGTDFLESQYRIIIGWNR